MARHKRALLLAAAALAVPAASIARAQDLPWEAGKAAADNAANEVPAVRYEYPEQVSVAAGKPAVVELHFRIRDGLHINSHTPRAKSLIRTDIMVVEPPGVKIDAVDFPAGSDYALKALPNEKLSVYTGEFVLHAHLTAKPGEHLVQAALRYQACDTDSCYPPKKAPVAIDIVGK